MADEEGKRPADARRIESQSDVAGELIRPTSKVTIGCLPVIDVSLSSSSFFKSAFDVTNTKNGTFDRFIKKRKEQSKNHVRSGRERGFRAEASPHRPRPGQIPHYNST